MNSFWEIMPLARKPLIASDKLAQPVAAHLIGGHLLVVLPPTGACAASSLLQNLRSVGRLQLGKIGLETLDLRHRILDLRSQQFLFDDGDGHAGHDAVARLHEHLENGSCCDGGNGKIPFLIGKHHAAPDHARRDRTEHRPDQRRHTDNGRRSGEYPRGGGNHPDTLVKPLGGIDPLERRLPEPTRDALTGRWVLPLPIRSWIASARRLERHRARAPPCPVLTQKSQPRQYDHTFSFASMPPCRFARTIDLPSPCCMPTGRNLTDSPGWLDSPSRRDFGRFL